MKKVAETLKIHIPGPFNYFRHRVKNAPTEVLDRSIQALKSATRGLRSFKNYRTRILLGCLSLNPL
jgi:transposase